MCEKKMKHETKVTQWPLKEVENQMIVQGRSNVK